MPESKNLSNDSAGRKRNRSMTMAPIKIRRVAITQPSAAIKGVGTQPARYPSLKAPVGPSR